MIRINYSIVMVSDMKRSVAFYRDVVGIPLKFESPGWSEFETEGATLALHPAKQPAPAETVQSVERAGQCRMGFQVSDLQAFHQQMTRHEVACVQPPTTSFGATIAQYTDPDGLIFSVSGQPAEKLQ